MFNLYQIVTGAQGGQALDNLAQQFGLSRDEVDSAVKALMPALSTAFMTKVAQPGGMNEIAGAMHDDQHKQAYADPAVAQEPSTQNKAGDIAGSIFGSSAILDQVVEQAAKFTGLPADKLRAMLPVVISLVLGGVATAMHNQGIGGLLGQLANSGLGNIFGGAPGQPDAPGHQSGGLGGLFGNILGGMFGQHAQPGQAAPQPAPQPAPSEQAAPSSTNPAPPMGGPAPGGFPMPPGLQAGMEAFSKMFQPGVHTQAGQRDDLGEQIGAILGDKKP